MHESSNKHNIGTAVLRSDEQNHWVKRSWIKHSCWPIRIKDWN